MFQLSLRFQAGLAAESEKRLWAEKCLEANKKKILALQADLASERAQRISAEMSRDLERKKQLGPS